MLLPTIPAPMTTTFAREGSSVVVIPSVPASRRPSRGQHLLPPSFGLLDLVEGVDVKAHHVERVEFKKRDDPLDEPVWTVAAATGQPGHDAALLPEEAKRIAHADLDRDAEQLGPGHHSRDADVDRESEARVADASDPGHDRARVEADLGHQVGGVRLLVEKD